MTPLERYKKDLLRDDFSYDPAQEIAIGHLQRLYDDLIAVDNVQPQTLMQRFSGKFKKQTVEPVQGLYFWGGVGRGKTYMMDTFYDSLPFKQKRRTHFHRFMQGVHADLRVLDGTKNPLTEIARKYADEARIICFDEFFVSDIGDAMILGRLFTALFENGLTLVATSNIPIERLYWNGLQRQRFEPAIQLLLQHTNEIHLNGEEDHRLRHLQHQQTYFLSPDAQFKTLFQQLAEPLAGQVAVSPVNQESYQESTQSTQTLLVCKRPIDVIELSSHVVWFNFDALCNGPRSQLDYIELASRFRNILVSDIPLLGGKCRGWIKARGTEDGSFETTETGERKLSYARQDDPARRFISLVDELYDRRVNLYLSADVPLEYLYSGGSLSFEFKRTYSRLVEMQSTEYINSVHQKD